MSKKTKQMATWSGDFGREYTDRNALSPKKFDAVYKNDFGVTRVKLNERFLIAINKNTKILEVGSNVGIQLACLQRMGFENLFGVELQSYAVELSKQKTHNINIIQGSAFDIPFKDGFFDLVFTSGVLIHISPDQIRQALKEIYRCSNRYIWGFEYWAPSYMEVDYRGRKNLLWKTDFAKLYIELFDDLKLIREEKLKYLGNENIDSMFMLEKQR